LSAIQRRLSNWEKTMKRLVAAATACLVSFACPASEIRYFSQDQVPTSDEIASLLAAQAAAPAEPSGHGGRTRLVRLLDVPESPQRIEAPAQALSSTIVSPTRADAAARVQVARLSSVGSVALALPFGVDAVRIEPQHRVHLDALAAGIKRLPENALITIAGHTDAYGSALYNIDLSLKRAMAVRAYLVQVHGIPGRRLVAIGKGKSEPLNRANPFANENRRVQVHAEYDVA
jgi:OmpA-OmpF porin, OOP family